MTEIEKTEAEIKVLQAKLELLKGIEAHKSQPKMNLHNEGEFSIVSYDNRTYYRLQLPAASSWYIETIDDYGGCALEMIENLKTKNELESHWLMNEVKYRKYDVEEPKPQTLYNILYDELGYDFNTYIVDLVENWLPEEHDTNSDGWNKCVRMLRENLR
jgi:hypothetical protein